MWQCPAYWAWDSSHPVMEEFGAMSARITGVQSVEGIWYFQPVSHLAHFRYVL